MTFHSFTFPSNTHPSLAHTCVHALAVQGQLLKETCPGHLIRTLSPLLLLFNTYLFS